jgi:hypothetical protein
MQRNSHTDSSRNRAAINWQNLDTTSSSVQKTALRAYKPTAPTSKKKANPKAEKSARIRQKHARGRAMKFAIQEAAFIINFTSL